MKVGQSKRASVAEALVNVMIGYVISMLAMSMIFPLFGIKSSFGQNMGIAMAFTIVSILRSYALRRLFNWWHLRN